MNLVYGSYQVHTMHSRQAFIFALYRAQTQNMGKYRGKGQAFVTSQIRASQGHTLFIRRQCIGYVVYSTLYPSLYPIPHALAYIGLQGTLYPTLHGSIAPYILPCTLYPIPYPVQVHSTLCHTLYPVPDAPYTQKKPDTSGDASGSMYRAKKSPAGLDTCRACSERRVVTYSKEGLDVSAPSIPAIVIVTSPMNIEPND